MANPACYVNGIMNAVEFDVGNFRKWLLGTVPGGSGPLVSYSSQNGYLVYFSDRRGMLPDPNNGNITSGEYGFEDVINSASPTGTPDGVLEAAEDVDQNGTVERWGAANVGNGQRVGNGQQSLRQRKLLHSRPAEHRDRRPPCAEAGGREPGEPTRPS